jgi:hypothetical protein
MDRDEISILYRGPSIEASYQVSVHLAEAVSEEKTFKNRQIRNKNSLTNMAATGNSCL